MSMCRHTVILSLVCICFAWVNLLSRRLRPPSTPSSILLVYRLVAGTQVQVAVCPAHILFWPSFLFLPPRFQRSMFHTVQFNVVLWWNLFVHQRTMWAVAFTAIKIPHPKEGGMARKKVNWCLAFNHGLLDSFWLVNYGRDLNHGLSVTNCFPKRASFGDRVDVLPLKWNRKKLSERVAQYESGPL